METAHAPANQTRQNFGFLLLLSLCHGVVDLCGGAVVALLPTLRAEFSLTYTMVGVISLCSNLTSSLTQPVFGILSDRSQRRWLLPVSLLLAGLGLAAVGWTSSYPLLLLAVIISALGTASFHPEGANAARRITAGARNTAMSVFSVGGNIGNALGPLYIGILLSLGGSVRATAWAFLLPGILSVLIFRLLPVWEAREAELKAHAQVRSEELPPTSWMGTVLITLVVILRSMINVGIVTYIPFFWIDVLGNPKETAVFVQVMYLMAGVAGTLLGARVADRIGSRRSLMLSFGLLAPLQWVLPHLTGIPLLICLFAAGFLVVSTFTVTLVLTQEYMPRNPGLASGLNLGLGFGMGGVGTWMMGMVADKWGIIAVFNALAALVVPAFATSALLPPTPQQKAPQPAAHMGD